MEIPGLTLLSQVIRDWNGENEDRFNPAVHVAVHYSNEAQRSANGAPSNHAAEREGHEWKPAGHEVCCEHPQVEFMVAGRCRVHDRVGLWTILEVVIATKIEHIRNALGWP